MWVEVLVNQGGCEVGSELGNVLCICSVESMEVEDASEVDVKLEVRFYHVFPMVKHVVVGSFGLDHIKSDVVSPDLPVRGGPKLYFVLGGSFAAYSGRGIQLVFVVGQGRNWGEMVSFFGLR
ncbi:hypothetical protein U1Q18_040564 [Sarracenia purpurea var. burkii]